MCAIYLCHQPTNQLHTLVPVGSERPRDVSELRLIEQKERVRLEGHASEHVGRVKWRHSNGSPPSHADRWDGQRDSLVADFFENEGLKNKRL